MGSDLRAPSNEVISLIYHKSQYSQTKWNCVQRLRQRNLSILGVKLQIVYQPWKLKFYVRTSATYQSYQVDQMPSAKEADTIRILIATDNHVGYNERDPIRGDDSWKTYHEIMVTAKERDVDMVLLAGDLFHENKPSRKSMYQVMRSLRMNCLGNKPCELEMLSDASESFYGYMDRSLAIYKVY